MSEKKANKFKKTTRLVGFYGKYGNFFVPENVQDVALEIKHESESVDARHDREFEIVVLIFGSLSRDHIWLEETEQGWKLTTPFGNLTLVKREFSSCTLTDDSDGDLVFTHRSANPKLYKLPSHNQ